MAVTLLIIMIIITILLCAFANLVTSQTNGTDIFPAKIFAQQKTISENSDLHLTCTTFGSKKKTMVYVYLCNGDFWIDKKMQKQDTNDTLFTIQRVGLHHSGNYSCVFSIRDDLLPKIAMRGHNVIQILVISNYLPADISIAGPSTVSEGDDVAFRCTVPDTLQTLGECKLIHSYLRRNETILQVQAFNVTRMEATFTIEDAVNRDSGNYSCVVLPSKCIQEKTLSGNNAVLLEVKVSLVFRVILSCGVITLISLVGLYLWWINKQMSGGKSKAGFSASSKAASQRANADRVEEQAEGEEVEAQNGDSFSSEEDEEYQNLVAGQGSTNGIDCDAVYSVANDPPTSPNPERVYAVSSRREKLQIQCRPDFN